MCCLCKSCQGLVNNHVIFNHRQIEIVILCYLICVTIQPQLANTFLFHKYKRKKTTTSHKLRINKKKLHVLIHS